MNKQQIEDLSMALVGFIVALDRAPKLHELEHFITNYMRGRKNGRIMAR